MANEVLTGIATVTIGIDDFSLRLENCSYQETRNVITKSYAGSDWQSSWVGKRSATFSGSGDVTGELAPKFRALLDAGYTSATIELGPQGDFPNGGKFFGTWALSGAPLSFGADGTWQWEITGSSHGAITYDSSGAGGGASV